MAAKPKPISAAELRASILRPPQWIFDPIDMEHILQIDKELGKRLMAQRLETQADLFRSMADGAAKAAKMMR